MEKPEIEKIHNDGEKEKKTKDKKIDDYSMPLEKKREEEEKLEKIENEIVNKLSILETEIEALELMEKGKVASSESDIEEQYEILNKAYREIQELKKEKNLTEEKIAAFLNMHKWFTDILNDFDPDVEH